MFVAEMAGVIYSQEPGAGHPEADLLKTNAWCLAEMIHVMDLAGMFLEDHEVGRLQYAGFLWLRTWEELAGIADRSNEHFWKIQPKHHYVMQRDAGVGVRMRMRWWVGGGGGRLVGWLGGRVKG